MLCIRLLLVLLVVSARGTGQSIVWSADGLGADGVGRAVRGVGDLDGDGVPDVVFGSQANFARAVSGRTGAVLYDWIGAASGDLFGWSVATAGDVDGDGRPDVLVGALNSAPGNGGYARVLSGATGQLVREFVGQPGDQLGVSVAGGRDFDSDGVPDAVVGSPGRVRVFSGADASELWTRANVSPGDLFGWSIDVVDDVNSDGVADVLVGAPHQGGVDAGAIHVLSGSDGSTIGVIPGFPGESIGFEFTSISDLDGNGSPEIVYVRFGNSIRTVDALTGFGYPTLGIGNGIRRVRALGDLDLDGDADVGVLSPDGFVQILEPVPPFDRVVLRFEPVPGDSIDAIGDVDQDGLVDFAVGFQQALSGAGRVSAFTVSEDNIWRNFNGNGDWHDAGNWSRFSVPGIGDRVVVPATTVVGPTLSTNGLCRSLTTEIGAPAVHVSPGVTLECRNGVDSAGDVTGLGELRLGGSPSGVAAGSLSIASVVVESGDWILQSATLSGTLAATAGAAATVEVRGDCRVAGTCSLPVLLGPAGATLDCDGVTTVGPAGFLGTLKASTDFTSLDAVVPSLELDGVGSRTVAGVATVGSLRIRPGADPGGISIAVQDHAVVEGPGVDGLSLVLEDGSTANELRDVTLGSLQVGTPDLFGAPSPVVPVSIERCTVDAVDLRGFAAATVSGDNGFGSLTMGFVGIGARLEGGTPVDTLSIGGLAVFSGTLNWLGRLELSGSATFMNDTTVVSGSGGVVLTGSGSVQIEAATVSQDFVVASGADYSFEVFQAFGGAPGRLTIEAGGIADVALGGWQGIPSTDTLVTNAGELIVGGGSGSGLDALTNTGLVRGGELSVNGRFENLGGTLMVSTVQAAEIHGNFPGDLVVSGPSTLDGVVVGQDLLLRDLSFFGFGAPVAVGACTVHGDFEADLGVSGASTSGGSLDVRGNVTVRESLDSPPALWTVGGDWRSEGAAATSGPMSGVVRFDGSTVQQVTSDVPILQWNQLEVAAGSTLDHVPACSAASVAVNGSATVHGPLSTGGILSVGTVGSLQALASVSGSSAVNVAGALSVANGPYSAVGDTSVGGGGVLALGSGPHTFGAALLVDGMLTNPLDSVFVFSGSAPIRVVAPSTLASVSVEGAPSIETLAVAGMFVQSSTSAGMTCQHLHVSGDCTWQGGPVVSAGPGSLAEIGGDLTWLPTGPSTLPPTRVVVHGDAMLSAAVAPVAGDLEFEGSNSVLLGAVQQLHGIRVRPGANVDLTPSPLRLTGKLLVQGGAVATSLDLDGGMEVQSGASLSLGAGTHTCAGDVIGDGLIAAVTAGASQLLLDGSGALSATDVQMPLVVDTPGVVSASGSPTARDGLRLDGGVLTVDGALRVEGLTTLAGGQLGASPNGTLDATGGLTTSGTVGDATGPVVVCGGDVSLDGVVAFRALRLDTTSQGLTIDAPAGITAGEFSVLAGSWGLGSDLRVEATACDVVGTLSVGSRTWTAVTDALDVTGVLEVGPAGALVAKATLPGAVTAIDVQPVGTLRLRGSLGAPAELRAAPGSVFSLGIQGALDAHEFSIRGVGPAGVSIEAGANLLDLSNGLFTAGSAAPGSVLLDLDRTAPTTLVGLGFDNWLGATTHNVKTDTSVPIVFDEVVGGFAGEEFELDPGGVLHWTRAVGSRVDWTAAEGADSVYLQARSLDEVEVAEFELWRLDPGSASQGVQIARFSPVGPGSAYEAQDAGLVGIDAEYVCLERHLRGARTVLASTLAQPRSAASQHGTRYVGPGGFPSIAAALAAGPVAGPVNRIIVEPGTHAPFTVGAAAQITALLPGSVAIDTGLAPVVLTAPAGEQITLAGLHIGAISSPFGIEVLDSDGSVVLDSLRVDVAAGAEALFVARSASVATYEVDAFGEVVLQDAALHSSGGAFSSFEGDATSRWVRVDVDVPQVLGAHADVLLPGSARRVSAPILWSVGDTIAFDIAADPSDQAALLFSFREDFVETPIGFVAEMPILVDLGISVNFGFTALDPAGSGTLEFPVLGAATDLGLTLSAQLLTFDAALQGRFGNRVLVDLTP